ncbi:MAG: hypothetical protein L0Z62_47405 [Gemmataceae bacterium]|nr:hypothetical protein [Gemmataceae bacterium]
MAQLEFITYLPEVECIITVAEGILGTQVIAVPDENGKRESLRVGKGMISHVNGKTYLPVGVVQFDYRGRRALVELPTEAGSGTWRLWVPFHQFRRQEEPA